jgi:hypothetical protein
VTARPAFELADVFRRHGEGYERANAGHLKRVERRVIRAVTACRTAALGGHVERCEDCGLTRLVSLVPQSPLSKMSGFGASGVACGAAG